MAIAASTIISTCCTLGMWRIGKRVWLRNNRATDSPPARWPILVLYFSAALWILLSTILSQATTAYLLRIMAR
jgi:hypothetical protein